MSLNITVSIPLSIAISIHKSSSPETGDLDPKVQQNILRSIVSAVKSLPDDSTTWSLGSSSPPTEPEEEEAAEYQTPPTGPEPEIRVSFSENDTHIPSRRPSQRPRRSSLKATTHPPLQKPSGPDITFPGAQFAFEIRMVPEARSIAVAAHGGVTSSELALEIWKKEGVPMREQRLFLGNDEIYNGRAHERDSVYEVMRLRGKFGQVRQGSIVVLVVGQGKR